MKIKNNIKRILSIVVSMMVMASLFTVTSFAAEPTTSDGTIDTTQKGSLKIVKYEGNDTTKPLAGVTFTYTKVADIEQIISDKTNTIAYSVEDSFKTTIKLGTADYTIDSKDYYKAETIQNALKATSYEDMKSYVTTNGGTNMTVTDDNGESTAEGLTLGLYVVVETKYPLNVEQPSNPFLVSLPSTVGTVDGNGKGDNLADSTIATKWIYDIVARPKNTTTTGALNIYKGIVIEGADNDDITDDKVGKVNDYNIGDKVTFKITADVPKDITKLKTYKIVDKLSDGLTYNKVLRVYGIKEDGSSVVLNEGLPVDNYDVNSDYIIKIDGQNITIKFVKRGALGDYTQVCVDLEATLNENAVVGDLGNPNNADLKYSKDISVENDKEYPDVPGIEDESDEALETLSVSEAPIVYTYAINLTKYIDLVADENKIDGVEFELQDKDGNAIKVKEFGNYYVKDNANDASNTVLVTATNGQILVKGLDAGIYYLKETKTKEGYNLLKDKIKIEIKSERNFVEDKNGEFIESKSGEEYCYLDEDRNPIFIMPGISIERGGKYYLNVGTEDIYSYSWSSGASEQPVTKYSEDLTTLNVSEATYGIENGTVNLNVVNKKGFDLPTTGGMGTWLFTIGGLVLMAGAGVLFAKGRKSTER